MTPFLTFLTPTYKRPLQLARCLQAVGTQTAVADLEHIVLPDHVGQGIAGMFARLPDYAAAVHGLYVHLLQDDDELCGPTVVADLRTVAYRHQLPPILLVRVRKGPWDLPDPDPWPPILGSIDLGCLVVRADVWRLHVEAYGPRYEGDFDFAWALWEAGYPAISCPIYFLNGAISLGKPEGELVSESVT